METTARPAAAPARPEAASNRDPQAPGWFAPSISRGDHGPDPGLCEELEQEGVLGPAVHDVRERHAVERPEARLELGDHAAGDLSSLDALARVLFRQHGDHVAVSALDSRHVCE